MGLSRFRVFLLAYSERYMAAPSPSGIARARATAVITRVAETSGQTPKDGSAALGAHLVLPKNSRTGTSAKNSRAGRRRATMMPIVVATETKAASIRRVRIAKSPGRVLLERSMARRPAEDGGPAGVKVELTAKGFLTRQPLRPSSADCVSDSCSSFRPMNWAASVMAARLSM